MDKSMLEQIEQNRTVASCKASKTTLMRNAKEHERWRAIVEVERSIILAKRTAAYQAITTVPRDTQYAVSLIVIDQKIV